jgi:N-acylneuraminate cytidylyltransferase
MITAFIPARGGSKGIPEKNIKELVSKPLFVYSMEYAINCSQIDEVAVSTDDDKIARIALKASAGIVKRPPELSMYQATTESAIHYFVNKFNNKPYIIVLLQPTSPYRPKGSLENAITHFT